jgi:putative transposase
MSDGQLSKVSAPSETEARRLLLLERKLSRCKRGSNRRKALKVAIARLKARETDRRKDWAEKLSTDLARRFDTIGIEDLKIANMTRSAKGTVEEPGRNVAQKAGLNRAILTNGWGLLADRLVDKAPGRVVKVPAAYTSQRCSACGIVDSNNRKSQADFECTSCGFAMNADVNAARNVRHEALWMAAGRVVTARAPSDGDSAVLVREPQLVA